jgi:hypothetical protein
VGERWRKSPGGKIVKIYRFRRGKERGNLHDPRIYVTDLYSIENYLVGRDVVAGLYRDAIRITNVRFQIEPVLDHFDQQLARFHRLAMPIMAWIVTLRRAGLRPNLGNVDPGKLLELTDDCSIRIRPSRRLEYLMRVSGVPSVGEVFRRVRHTCTELKRIQPKRFLRGKFELWFLVQFWKKLIKHLRGLSIEAGGRLDVKIALEEANSVAVLVEKIVVPRSLELFLGQHLLSEDNLRITEPMPLVVPRKGKDRMRLFVRRIISLVKRS